MGVHRVVPEWQEIRHDGRGMIGRLFIYAFLGYFALMVVLRIGWGIRL